MAAHQSSPRVRRQKFHLSRKFKSNRHYSRCRNCDRPFRFRQKPIEIRFVTSRRRIVLSLPPFPRPAERYLNFPNWQIHFIRASVFSTARSFQFFSWPASCPPVGSISFHVGSSFKPSVQASFAIASTIEVKMKIKKK